jgi:hypothetical protein
MAVSAAASRGSARARSTTARSQRRRGIGARRSEKPRQVQTRRALQCRRKFLRYYPKGFVDADYLELERGYKWQAHQRWLSELGEEEFRRLLRSHAFGEIARRAVAIESRTNLLFSFEKMALRDAVKPAAGAKAFAEGLFDFLHGGDPLQRRFTDWCEVIADLPRRQTRVLTWPVATVFGFIAQPRIHFFMKPMVTRKAAERYGFSLPYQSRPQWQIYAGVLAFARRVRADLQDMGARDMIDLQSFLWVQGSDEYPD